METIGLIRRTELEELVLRYEKDIELDPNSKLNLSRVNIITRQIKYAYAFLCKLGKPKSLLTFEEFRVAGVEIKRRAEARIYECEGKLKTTPFLRWIKKMRLRAEISNAKFVIDYGYSARLDDDTFYGQWNNWRGKIPMNLPTLVQEIFQMHYGFTIEVGEIKQYC